MMVKGEACMKRKNEYFRGCLLGGAVGDALGWPVEFKSYEDIKKKFGQWGIQDLICFESGKAEITDDTQMTLFTAEGILRAETRGREKGICNPASVVYYAYLRWLSTQGYESPINKEGIYDGWLINVEELQAVRAPGNTCLSALISGKQAAMDKPINNSKGCGGVMRVAPAGLFYTKDKAFERAAEFAALTHGHPSGYLSAGALAYLIAAIIEGSDIEAAVKETILELSSYENHEECSQALLHAVDLYHSDVEDLKAIEKLGEGWVGEEALAISVYCALKYQKDFKKALITAVNHDGDSDSTGAITGNILGAYLGVKAIPKQWIDTVELRDEITEIADDLLKGYENSSEWQKKYPVY
jgi:ADP-ribosylglycohydrolase